MALRIEKAFDVSMDTLLRMKARSDSYMRQRAGDIDVRRDQPV
jgi:plasmid maintenance system antidote protein VapI